jgi:hypothetical protein
MRTSGSRKRCVRFEDTTSIDPTTPLEQAISLAVVHITDKVARRVSEGSEDEFDKIGIAEMMPILDLKEGERPQRQADQNS